MNTVTQTPATRTKHTLAATLALLVFGTFGVTPAFAKACKNVDVQVHNKTGKEVKIIDLDYYDIESGIWRSEPIINSTVGNGRYWQVERNLERVNGQDVTIRIDYRVRLKDRGFKQWSKVKNAKSSTARCGADSFYSVTLK